jgi:hypothetical protein
MSDHFTELATFRGLGGVLNSLVGPGPAPGSERLYRSYIYLGNTLDIVAVDPESGAHEVFTSPVKTEPGAWAMAVGPDEKLYVGTLPNAHLLRLDPATGSFVDLGRPSETESYIWQLAAGSDRRLYGCTYPSCKLVSYDPATGKMADLGRMDPREQYARSVAASDDGFVYAGIGTSQAHLVAYEIRTGEHRDILPEAQRVTGTAMVARGEGGVVFGVVGEHHFRLQGWQAIPISAAEYQPRTADRLRDGRWVTVEGTNLRVTDHATHESVTHPIRYPGKEIDLFRLGLGPDGMIYASSVLPIHFFRVDPRTGALTMLGELGGGEYYSFLRYGTALLGAAYSGLAPLMIYHPEQPFHPGPGAEHNPRLVHYEGEDSGWRPQAMIAGPDGKVYLGAVAGYGKLGGPLVVFDPATRAVQSFPHVVKDQSVVSLAVAGGLIVGGTTVGGGGGSFPTATEAALFLWDPVSQQKQFETVPVPGAREITDLVAGGDGHVFGIAGGRELFVFDVPARRVIHQARLPFSGVVYNAIAPGPRGRLFGLAAEGIFSIDPHSYHVRMEAPYPRKITAGAALEGDAFYFAAGPHVVRCDLRAGGGPP